MTMTWRQNAGLLALRAGVGGVLIAHGVQKLFGWLGGHGLAGTGAAFEQMGFQPGRPAALAAGLGEAGGGVLIALGLATPAAGAAAAGTMIPATAVHAPSGFFATGGGYEYPALLGVSAAAMTLMGPGDWSLDARLDHRLNQPWMAATAIIASSAVSLAIVQRRRRVLVGRAAETTSRIPNVAPADADPDTAAIESP
jgi:putative oxidoreductase